MWKPIRKRVKRYDWRTGERWLEWQDFYQWEGRRYVKKPSHKKKEKSQKELDRQAWREHKQVKRDKAKRQDLHGWRSDGCPKWLKRHCNKKHRQWERRMIEKERYEELGVNYYKRKDIFDPWLWD